MSFVLRLYTIRRIYAEGNFALQKDNHNMRKTRKRGNIKVSEHCLMSAMALNLKRLVKYLQANPRLSKFINIISQKLYSTLKKQGSKFKTSNPTFILRVFVNTPCGRCRGL
ncbi:MAG: transposase [Firmicutes bacterium]|nr:transposase [Bacillota bacterium]